VAEVRLDELVAWQEDGRGGVTGFTGERGEHRLGLLGRFLLPHLDADFAVQGDLLKVERDAFFTSHISGLANLTQRRIELADPFRVALLTLLIVLLPMPSVVTAGRWWLLIVSGLTAALALYMLVNGRMSLRDSITVRERPKS
jgi:hypothetical protein